MQTRVYSNVAPFLQGTITREQGIITEPYIAEENIEAGTFVYKGSKSNTCKQTGTTGERPIGIAVFSNYQIGQGNSIVINQGETLAVAIKGYVASGKLSNSCKKGQKILVDPTTNRMMASDSDTGTATRGEYQILSIDMNINEWKKQTAGKLSLVVDGVKKSYTSLDFSSVSSLADIVNVINTGITADASCQSLGDNGVIFKSNTTGSTSSIDVSIVEGDITELLQINKEFNTLAINGADALIDTGFVVSTENNLGQSVEIRNI